MTMQRNADELVERLFEASLGMLDLMNIYLGHRLFYYQTLQKSPAGMTSVELARAAGTNPRYAREWLEQQGASGFLELKEDSDDPDKRKYALPEHAFEVLVDPTSLNYIVPLPEMFVAMAQQAPEIVEAHRTGDGVSWEQLGDEVRRSQVAFNRAMFINLLGEEYLPSVPDLHERLSKGTPARVADIACGGGWSSIAIAKAYPIVVVDGFDIDAPSVEIATANAVSEGVSERVTFHHADASNLDGEYDLVLICEAVHDMPQPVPVLEAARKIAGDDGTVLVMDERVAEKYEAPANEIDRLMLGISTWVCLPDSMSSQPSVATGTAMRPSTLRKFAEEAGFQSVEILPIENDFFRFYRLHQ